jgi:hypothetical protein
MRDIIYRLAVRLGWVHSPSMHYGGGGCRYCRKRLEKARRGDLS